MTNDDNFIRKVAVIAAFAAVTFVLTLIIRIPIPATDGYFNIGDSVIMFGALLFGPWFGLLVGAIGASLADSIGFPQFILATMIVKGLEGFLVGFVARSTGRTSDGGTLFALIVGIVTMVGGYFMFEAIIYPWLARFAPFFNVTDSTAAIAEILPNLLQGIVSAAIAFGAWRVSRRAFSTTSVSVEGPAE